MSDINQLNWKDYEAITKYIYESLGVQYGIKVVGYGSRCKVQGRSGVKHQVDVLTEQLVDDRQLLTAIECKYWNKKVDKEVVMKLSKVMQDADISAGIIVCKTGFTKDTLTFAAHEGINLVELKEIGEDDTDFGKDVEVATLDIHLGVICSRAIVTCIDLGGRVIVDEKEIMAMHYAVLHDADGHIFCFGSVFKAFSDELSKREELLKTATINFPISPKVYWKLGNEVITVENIDDRLSYRNRSEYNKIFHIDGSDLDDYE